ncbi:hypothetical protein WIS52_17075 [Pseudonocardia nematodicida]|uniref:Uncharacterized protein n=1 Tax=Pseudonocardia nematodicida TaxID=1206997 RepID=A0ABV1KCJ3_9PSEU
MVTGAGAFRVDPDVVGIQCGVLDDLAETVSALEPSHTDLDTEAYGMAGRLFASSATRAMRSGAYGIRALSRSLAELSSDAKDAAGEYLRGELATVQLLTAIDVPRGDPFVEDPAAPR